ncbi:TetR/AcrR family transcriptional regulator [Bacillus timonensis]|uniref:TetR/AcrR family transcriptional regulator n=1 Tax=Bacillus timonensis TaxID=1033734 RepID=A0A4V3V814_9BACI|nr:TetR/AcrR family transcriptional regulator [Bacillus timonensis]THE13443.1 TetR/AcrR family transcriptional regulator [Bacillus timonensis]
MGRESKFTKSDLYQATNQLLLQYGYNGFHFGLLAEQLNVTRAALYKYFDNKDELITEYMVEEMERFLLDLQKMKEYPLFKDQLDYLLGVIFKYSRIHQILSMIFQIQKSNHVKVNEALELLETQHEKMYSYLNDFVQLGKRDKLLKSEFPNHLILGFIFQTVNIPNYSQLPEQDWKNLVMEFLCSGMFNEK